MAASRNKQSSDVLTSLRRRLNERLGEGQGELSLRGCHIAVAFSGGRDSSALLHAMATLRPEFGFTLSALHIHHGLSSNADLWVAFAEDFCKLLEVALQVERVTVSRDSGTGIEAAARDERYRVFSQTAADVLLLAHHQDDQAETLLFNLLRGAGVHGAAAMPVWRELVREGATSRLLLGRPWLDIARANIDGYVAQYHVRYIDDESNADARYSRNHLRQHVVPRLRERYPQASSSLADAARRFGEAAQLLDALADLDLATLERGEVLALDLLLTFDEMRQKNALRRWLAGRKVRLSSEARLVEFLRQCRDASGDAAVSVAFGTFTLRRWQGGVYCVAEPLSPLSPLSATQVWPGNSSVGWCGGDVFIGAPSDAVVVVGSAMKLRAGALLGRVELRAREGSETIRLHRGGPSRPLRLLFQERGVPPWERSRVPLLWVENQLAAVGGIGVAADFIAEPGAATIDFVWRPRGRTRD